MYQNGIANGEHASCGVLCLVHAQKKKSFKKIAKPLRQWRRQITNRQQKAKSYRAMLPGCHQIQQMTLQWKWELGLSQALWPWYKMILAQIDMAILSINTEIRGCVSVPKAGLSLFLTPAVDLLDWVCKRAPKQVKGPENILNFFAK